MIYDLKVKLIYGRFMEDEWEGTLEIDSFSVLEELHEAIQNAVEFDDDHLYEFYVSRTERSRQRTQFDDENGEVYTKTIESIFPLEKKKKLFYLFDYGDGWIFQVSLSRKKPHPPEPGIKYPRLKNELGKKPQQYPIWDE